MNKHFYHILLYGIIFTAISQNIYGENPASTSLLAYKEQRNTDLYNQKSSSEPVLSPPTSPIEIVAQKSSLPITILPANESELSTKDTTDLAKFARALPAKESQEIINTLKQSPPHLRSMLTLVRTQPENAQKIATDKSLFSRFLAAPQKLLTQKSIGKKPIIKTLMDAMSSIKKFMSPSQWWQVMNEFVGSILLKFWISVWQLVRDALASVVGTEKIYELSRDGTIKTDGRGNRVPKLIPQFRLNENGESVKEMIPTKWYNILENENSLLGLFVVSGIDGSVASIFKSLDRLLFRPMAHTVLDIPLWKLSHVHYQLAMTELQRPNTPLVNPVALATKILENRNQGLILTATFPFRLRTIMSQKDSTTKATMLNAAITQHLWSIYQPIWQELEQQIKVKSEPTLSTNLTTNDATKFQGAPVTKVKEFGDKLAHEIKNVAVDSAKAKILRGPVAPYLAYAQLAMNIPQVVFGFQNTTQPATTLVDNNGNIVSDEVKKQIIRAIDICDALAQRARSNNLEQSNNETIKQIITIDDQRYAVSISKPLLSKLLEAQERGLREYLPFFTSLSGEPYESYIIKLLMPRMIMKFIPEPVRTRLGIFNYADAAANIDLIKTNFAITFKTLAALSSLMAVVKKFEGTTSFAGRYVEIGDTFDRCLQDISALVQSVYPVPKDDWQKRIINLVRRASLTPLSRKEIKDLSWPTSWFFTKETPAFSMTQRNRLANAIKKSGNSNPALFFTKDEIKQYLNNGITPPRLHQATQSDINKAVGKQQNNKPLSSYEPGKQPYTYAQLVTALDDHYNNRPTDLITSTTLPNAVITQRAYEIALHTFGLLSLNRSTRVDAFFSAGKETTAKSAASIEKDFKSFEAKINSNLALAIGNAQEFINVLHMFYGNYGLREIIAALDEHYRVTGQTGKEIPLSIFAKIALKEGCAHLVGLGADKLLKKGLTPLLNQINRLQDSGMMGGAMITQMTNQYMGMFLGNIHGKTNAYHATRALIKNVFDYGAGTALKADNILGSVGTKFIPTQFSGGNGVNEYQELMAHAKMAAESGKAPSPLIAQRLKKAGIDPATIAKQQHSFMDIGDIDEEEFMRQFSGRN